MKNIRKKKIEKQRIEQTTNVALYDDTEAVHAGNKKLKVYTDELTGVEMTSGRTSGSLTSTAMSVSYDNDTREATAEEILQSQFNTMKKMKKKGFVRLTTNLGTLDLELHCDIAPRACTNFIGLAEKGKYNGTSFHRSIRNFMIQGGKPSKGTELETSLWGGRFEDEFDDRLKHQGPGIVSMANAGPGTNKRQFFITYKSAPHLDRKHSVFGRVANGMDVLKAMECAPTDKKDRPRELIKINQAVVLVNPVKEAEKNERIRIHKRIQEKAKEKETRRASALGTLVTGTIQKTSDDKSDAKKSKSRIGHYLPQKNQKRRKESKSSDAAISNLGLRLPPPPKKTSFVNFSNW